MNAYFWGIGGVTVLVLISAWLAAAESAFFFLSKPIREALRDRTEKRASSLLVLLKRPRRLTLALRVTAVLARLLSASLVLWCALRLAEVRDFHAFWSVAAHLVVVMVLLLAAETVPRAYAIGNAEAIALGAAPMVSALIRIGGPFLGVTVRSLNLFARSMGVRWAIPYPTAEEMLALVEAGEEEGEIEDEEREMIHSIFELGETTVRELMVPRVDVIAVERTRPVRDALDLITTHGHSRLPVYEEGIDRIVGLLYAKDLLRSPVREALDTPVEQVMRPPYFVPEAKRVDDLLHEFQKEKKHLAVVVDEYGGTAGLVTLEDVLEEIVGEIEDEYDRDEALYIVLDDDTVVVNAKISIDDLNERFHINLPADRHETFGGYLYDLEDRVPEEGETFEEKGLQFKVEKVNRQRIARVRIRKLPPPPPEEGVAEGAAGG
ncbi:MAG: HlyC/CorC family transporter [Candidatus Eisenbacteria bacterium]|nr:HlyC/CorC family transporter [Candidatus Eisenbacteria bacterium]